MVYPVVRVLHRASIAGVENLPPGPYLLVGNHPPCVGSGEFLSLMALWAHRFGASRPLAGYTHIAAHRVPPLPWLFRQIGAIPSTYEAAEAALAAGVPIAMFPGGDHEAFQPFWKPGVDFDRREGFLRIARKAGVPIVPFAITGQSAPVLVRARILAWLAIWPRALGVKRYGITALAVMGAVVLLTRLPLALPWRCLAAYLWMASPFALASWIPTRTRIRIGKPLDPGVSTRDVERAIEALQ